MGRFHQTSQRVIGAGTYRFLLLRNMSYCFRNMERHFAIRNFMRYVVLAAESTVLLLTTALSRTARLNP